MRRSHMHWSSSGRGRGLARLGRRNELLVAIAVGRCLALEPLVLRSDRGLGSDLAASRPAADEDRNKSDLVSVGLVLVVGS